MRVNSLPFLRFASYSRQCNRQRRDRSAMLGESNPQPRGVVGGYMRFESWPSYGLCHTSHHAFCMPTQHACLNNKLYQEESRRHKVSFSLPNSVWFPLWQEDAVMLRLRSLSPVHRCHGDINQFK